MPKNIFLNNEIYKVLIFQNILKLQVFSVIPQSLQKPDGSTTFYLQFQMTQQDV